MEFWLIAIAAVTLALVALLTGGEGWHNNHHAFPVSARHGMAWYEVDVNYLAIWMLEKVGLATKVNAKRV